MGTIERLDHIRSRVVTRLYTLLSACWVKEPATACRMTLAFPYLVLGAISLSGRIVSHCDYWGQPLPPERVDQ